MCFRLTHIPCDDWENIYTLSYYHHQIGSMNYYPLFRTRSWNKGVRCLPFCILMNLWYGSIASWDIRVLVVFAPNLALCHRHAALLHARYPTDDWHLTYFFLLVYFSVEVCLKGVFPHYVSTRRDPCVRVYAPLTLPTREKTKSNRVTRLSTCTFALANTTRTRMSLDAIMAIYQIQKNTYRNTYSAYHCFMT